MRRSNHISCGRILFGLSEDVIARIHGVDEQRRCAQDDPLPENHVWLTKEVPVKYLKKEEIN